MLAGVAWASYPLGMVKPALTLQDAEVLVNELDRADAAGASRRMPELEEAIEFLMRLNFHLAGNGKPNALIAFRLLRRRKVRMATETLETLKTVVTSTRSTSSVHQATSRTVRWAMTEVASTLREGFP
jgi:hypothetical protein